MHDRISHGISILDSKEDIVAVLCDSNRSYRSRMQHVLGGNLSLQFE
jgi:hypothetical protein